MPNTRKLAEQDFAKILDEWVKETERELLKEAEEEKQELDAQEKRAKIDSLKTGTYGKTCQCQACTEREKRRTSLKKIRGIVKLEERQRIRMTLDKEIKKYLKRMSEQKEPSDIFEESKEWYKERLENMERLDEWNEKECDKIIAKQAEETAN